MTMTAAILHMRAQPARPWSEAAVPKASRLAQELDPKAVWYAYGTCRLEPGYAEPGILNQLKKM